MAVGEKYGFLTILSEPGKNRFGQTLVLCLCDCGAIALPIKSSIKTGRTISCGCYRVSGKGRVTHGHRRKGRYSSAYTRWCNMKARCLNPRAVEYPQYGGRGIRVCERWLSFENFLADMGEPPENMSLDRIDNDGDYCPANCRWADNRTQMTNRSDNHFIDWQGERLTIVEWEERFEMPKGRLRRRIHLGMPVERAMQPTTMRPGLKGKRLITWRGETLSVGEWERRLGMPKNRLRQRLYVGWPLERAMCPDTERPELPSTRSLLAPMNG